ncbi:hypothetical protein GCM10010341_56740 [Streptomyces noursei]|nr:hypothetical protein GCM10010341_56740 [Streptomyces noursei]
MSTGQRRPGERAETRPDSHPDGQPAMHAGMHPADEHLVRRLIGRQFPQWAGLSVVRIRSGGTVNAMYRLGDDMVVRLPFVEGGAKDVALEQEWLPRLASGLPWAVPEVLGGGRPAEGYPWRWSVLRWLAGENPRAGALSEPVGLAEDLAGFVAAMRSLTLPGAPTAHRGGAIASLDAATRAAIDALRGLPQEEIDCDAVAAVIREVLGES